MEVTIDSKYLVFPVNELAKDKTVRFCLEGEEVYSIGPQSLSYRGEQFFLNGKPFRILSGAMHYFRVPREYWRDRLLKLKACGLNTVETYACWSLHEREEGMFDFSDRLDVREYVRLARELGLFVILRPGPYICSEFDWGGLPSWLLRYPGLQVRCANPLFLEKTARYLERLMREVEDFLPQRQGNILMVQVENEYGSYGNDQAYLQELAGIYRRLGVSAMLFTSDGPNDLMISGGSLPECLVAANFGSRPEEAFAVVRRRRPNQPLFCGEFWDGWFDHWYDAHHARDAAETAQTVDKMLEMGASINLYMFHGGTNFGFCNGANDDGAYQPTVTSYDFDALLNQAGDRTPKYEAIREVPERRFGKAPCEGRPDAKKAAYGACELKEAADLLGQYCGLTGGREVRESRGLLTMEEVGQDFGFLLYRTVVRGPFERSRLYAPKVRDRAQVFIDGEPAGVWERDRRSDEIYLEMKEGESRILEILVENMGRVNYGPAFQEERKGLPGGVILGYQLLFGWEVVPLPMEDLSALRYGEIREVSAGRAGRPRFLRGTLRIEGEACDTYLRTDGLTKGAAYVNGHNLGRYWSVPPTKTLYVPGAYLRPGDNEVVLLELQPGDAREGYRVCFTDAPEL